MRAESRGPRAEAGDARYAGAPRSASSAFGPRPSALRWHRLLGAAAWHAVMLLVCAFVLIPIVLVVLGSFKSVNEFFASPYGLPETFGLGNYRKAWSEANLQVALRNSVIATGLGGGISTVLACLASYGLARFRFWGRLGLRLLFVGGLVVPVPLIILPIFILFRQIGIL